MMNIGILGTGFGAYHASLLNNHPKVNRLIVFGRNETKLQKLKEELNVEVTQNIEDILLDPDVDIVDLCLPSHLHRSHAIDALKHGKHVFCETPVCFHLEDALLMQQAEKQYGKKFWLTSSLSLILPIPICTRLIANKNTENSFPCP